MIEADSPADWRDLQDRVARILNECGFDAKTEQQIPLARGNVVIDVLATDVAQTPPAMFVCECKHWQSAASKDVVHAFRTVVSDAGAHRGLLISSAGFQSGAREASRFSNIDLLSWTEFQALFAERWFRTFMAPALVQRSAALHEYTEPFNSGIMRKADALGPADARRLKELRAGWPVFLALFMIWFSPFSKPKMPQLPLRIAFGDLADNSHIPRDILDAGSLRQLMDAVTLYYESATAEFDALFGGRA